MEEKINTIIIKSMDSVAVVIEALPAGCLALVKVNGEVRRITATEDIPIYHKIAMFDMAAGQEVYKYGESIGRALVSIKAGQHVHSHNLVSIRETIAK